RERRTEDRTEVAIADREGLREVVVEREIVVVVVPHRVPIERLLGTFGFRVDLDEPVVGARVQRRRGSPEIALLVASDPAVVEIRTRTEAWFVERVNYLAKVTGVAVATDEGPGRRLPLARQPVDTRAVGRITSLEAAPGVVRCVRNISENAEVVVEGVVLLHRDDDVFRVAQISIG